MDAMSEPHIPQKSPIVETVKPGTYFWCSCGNSSNQPFCDGSHKGTEFVPQKVEITEEKHMSHGTKAPTTETIQGLSPESAINGPCP